MIERNLIRGSWKSLVLLLSLCQCLFRFLPLRNPSPAERARWLQRSCQLVLRRLGFAVRVLGQPPQDGLVASNHLSYLDILFYGAALPCVFVAKREVRSWPLLGLLAALGGTVFVERQSRQSAAAAAARIQELLAAGVAVLVFPEGTSSDGAAVLPFYPSLLEPAIRLNAPITSAAIGYSGGEVCEEELCYYGDITFATHLFQTLQLPEVLATLRFAPEGKIHRNRKQAAIETRLEVEALRSPRAVSQEV